MNKITIEQLDESYSQALYKLQQTVFDEITDKSLLRFNSLETFKNCLKNHYCLGIFDKNNLIAFGILYFNNSQERLSPLLECFKDQFKYVLKSPMQYNKKLAMALSLKHDNGKSAIIKLIIVKKEYRGQHFQRLLIEIFEKYSLENGYNYLMCSVSPNNLYSLKNFMFENYKIIKEKKLYNGLNRYILFKKL